MKRKSLLLVLALALCLALSSFVACGIPSGDSTGGGNNPPAAQVTKISTIMTETANNTDLQVEGVVFAVMSNGYYINDGTGSIFVLDDEATNVVGDKVKIDGAFRLRNGQPIINCYEVLETTAGMENKDILEYQLDIFRNTMEEYKLRKGQKLVFIHGKGEGVLRQRILWELQTKYKRHQHQDASFKQYGYGATLVTIK